MFRIDLVSLFPAWVETVFQQGVIGRARDRGIIEYRAWNPRDYSRDKQQRVDDRPYGGGPGMVMSYQPLADAIDAAREKQPGGRIGYLSPQGKRLDHAGVSGLAGCSGLVIVSGRYEAIDERIIESRIDEEWSIGDYVLTGGEIAAMVLIDSVCRLLPGVLGHDQSAGQDSFVDGLLDCPHYTRPGKVDDMAVPDVLLNGSHADIEQWRLQQSLGNTWRKRPDLLEGIELTEFQQGLLRQYIAGYSQPG